MGRRIEVAEELVARIDRVRGPTSRKAWVAVALEMALQRAEAQQEKRRIAETRPRDD